MGGRTVWIVICVLEYRVTARKQSKCRMPDVGTCNTCLRQPPSLFHSALHVFSKMVYNLEGFELITETTYEQYMYSSMSNRVNYVKLLPPQFPNIWLTFLFQSIPCRFHVDCPREGSWEGNLPHTFLNSMTQFVNSLMKSKYMCQHCSKGLFLPNTCPHPLHRAANYGLNHM
jgi:hypothetical protein